MYLIFTSTEGFADLFRISVEEALLHPYMCEYSMPSDEPVADQPFAINDSDTSKTLADWKGASAIVYTLQSSNVYNLQTQFGRRYSCIMKIVETRQMRRKWKKCVWKNEVSLR